MTISKTKTLYTFALIGLLFPVFFSSLSIVLIKNVNIRLFFLIVSTCIFVFLQLRTKKTYKMPVFLLFFVCVFIICILNGFIIIRDIEIEAYLRYLCLLLCLLIGYRDTKWLPIFIKLLYLFSIFYIVTTIWLYCDKTSLFKYFASTIYPNESRFSYWVSEGFTTGVTDHYSTNGMMLANAITVIFSFLIYKKKSVLNIMLFILSIIALIMTGKRAHLLFSLIGILITMIIYLWKSKNKYFKYLVGALILLIGISIISTYSPLVSSLFERFTNMKEDSNITLRYLYWNAAINSFTQHKFLGIGWFGFRNVVAPIVNYTGHCHNIYVQLLCETGIIGTIIFSMYFIISMRYSIKLVLFCSKYRHQVQECITGFAVFSLSYQVFFLLYGITGNPLYDAYQYPVYLIVSFTAIYLYRRNARGKEI